VWVKAVGRSAGCPKPCGPRTCPLCKRRTCGSLTDSPMSSRPRSCRRRSHRRRPKKEGRPLRPPLCLT